MRIFEGDIPPDILIAGDVSPRPPAFDANVNGHRLSDSNGVTL